MNGLPRLLSKFERVPGVIKEDYEDFLVEELPLYECCGQGTHVHFTLEKRGLSTMQAVSDLARELGVAPRDIGYAGLKDARAVTRQRMSIEHVEPAALERLSIPRIRVFDLKRHGNKLKLGHLAGNRFTIRVRRVEAQHAAGLQAAWSELCRRGVPNAFGPQRFGSRGDGWQVGRAIVRNQPEEAIDWMLGRPSEQDAGEILRARRLYEEGRFADAAAAWPRMFRNEKAALWALAKTRGDRRRGFLAVDRSIRHFYVSAYQSYMFNRLLARRLELGIDQMLPGDLAWRHANEAVFSVEDVATEQARCVALEISPSGPLFGYRMTMPQGEPGRMEQEILREEGLMLETFRPQPLRIKGSRRPLRFPVHEGQFRLGADARGNYLELSFVLPPGCYATSLLTELFTALPGAEE